MAADQPKSGGDHLEKRSDVIKSQRQMPKLDNILVVEDNASDADRMQATLHLMQGYDIEVRSAATISTAVDQVLAKRPALVLLDDRLKPADDATQTIPFLRRAGYDGPILVISGEVTRRRRKELMDVGATDVLHKDDVDSVRLAETISKIFGPGGFTPKDPPKSSD